MHTHTKIHTCTAMPAYLPAYLPNDLPPSYPTHLRSMNLPSNKTQRAQYPLIQEHGLNCIGLHIMI